MATTVAVSTPISQTAIVLLVEQRIDILVVDGLDCKGVAFTGVALTMVAPLPLAGGITTSAVSQPIRTTGSSTGCPGARSGICTYIASGNESGSTGNTSRRNQLVL